MKKVSIVYTQIPAPNQLDACHGCTFNVDDQEDICTAHGAIQNIRCYSQDGRIRIIWKMEEFSTSEVVEI